MSYELPLAARVVRSLLRSRARGTWRTATTMTRRLPSLRTVPICFGSWPPIFFDLRDPSAQGWLTGAPYDTCPYEPAIQSTLRQYAKPGDTVVDVGANVGLHTVLLSQAVGPTGHVYAFEPNPRLAGCLSRTVAGLPNTTLHLIAVGERRAEMTLFVPETDHGQGSLADWTAAAASRSKVRSHPVRVVPVADIVSAQPSLMKVDVEGAEVMVFRGALPLLDRTDAPVILFEELTLGERGMGVPPHAAADYLRSLAAPRYELEIVEADGTRRPYTTQHCGWINVLAVPASRR